ERAGRPFEIGTIDRDGREARLLARAVIDASGTWRYPNPAGASGVPAIGERESAARIRYGIPDVFGGERQRYAGRRVLVVGSGHSAKDSIIGLARLKADHPRTTILWAMRSPPTEKTFGGLTDDQLSSRGALGERAKAVVDEGAVAIVAPFRVRAFSLGQDAITVSGESADGERSVAVDEVIVATGFRPDFSASSEIRLDLHPWLECPRALGPLIDPNEHSCGTVPPHGVDELAHPERDFYIVGMKSYGRAPTFLMMTGYEQVRSVVAALAGDWQAAREMQLVLPETGVCNGPGLPAEDVAVCDGVAVAGAVCCGKPREAVAAS
ncbi:MAG: FAD-dependent oxidoreductase, partial [Dongiaceae bacterium]